MSDSGNSKITTVRWQIDLYKRIEKEAQKKGLPVASYIRMVVKEYIDAAEQRGEGK